jgi:PAP2 superfamily
MKKMLVILNLILLFLSQNSAAKNCRENFGANNFSSPLKNNNAKEYSSTVPNCWIKEFAILERWVKAFRPTGAARALAYINMAAYETVLPSMPNFKSNQIKFKELQIPKIDKPIEMYNWNIALNECYAYLDSSFLFRAGVHCKTIAPLKDSLSNIYKPTVSKVVFNNSKAWGNAVAKAVWAYAQTDIEGAKQADEGDFNNYVMPIGNGYWQGEQFGGFTPQHPFWSKIRTFTTFGNDLVSPPPPPHSIDTNSVYYKDQLEVYKDWKNMDYEKRWRAEFWSDDIVLITFGPSTRYFVIAAQMVVKEKFNLEQALHLYCKLGIGLNDATTACWKSKYIYNTERPWQFIQKNIDPNFKAIMGDGFKQGGKSPAFPAYPSGHSACAGVGEMILTQFFGENYLFTDYSHLERKDFNGTPRTFTTMKEMADDNAYSRISIGAHVRFDCDEGLRLGRLIGKNVNDYQLVINQP